MKKIVFLVALVAYVHATLPSLNFRIGFEAGAGLRYTPGFRRARYGRPPPPSFVRSAPFIRTVQAVPLIQQFHTVQTTPLVQQYHTVQSTPLVQQIQAVAPALSIVNQPVAYGQPAITAVRAEPFDPHPQYSYGYSVSDSLTGDQKSAQESRDGDVVQGQYSLVEPDGALRTVTYTSDSINGFNAVVDRSPSSVATIATAPVVTAVAPAVLTSVQSIGQPVALIKRRRRRRLRIAKQ